MSKSNSSFQNKQATKKAMDNTPIFKKKFEINSQRKYSKISQKSNQSKEANSMLRRNFVQNHAQSLGIVNSVPPNKTNGTKISLRKKSAFANDNKIENELENESVQDKEEEEEEEEKGKNVNSKNENVYKDEENVKKCNLLEELPNSEENKKDHSFKEKVNQENKIDLFDYEEYSNK